MELHVGYVAEVSDRYHAERIKAIIAEDRSTSLDKIPYAFPLLPKMIHVKPKVGEAVLVVIDKENKANSQRYYIGPIISQPQKMYYDDFENLSATKMLNGGMAEPEQSVDDKPAAKGTLPENDEVAILGRKDSEIILGDNDVRIRCGVRVTDPISANVTLNGTENSEVTRTAPAFVQLKEYKKPLVTKARSKEISAHTATLSTANIVADKINLISQNGDGGFSLNGGGQGISDEKMKKIIETAHKLPYGDVLCEFLSEFMTMFLAHYHPYPGERPDTGEPYAEQFWKKYSTNKNRLEDILLSKDVRIN